MSNPRSRREFLKQSAAVSLALGAAPLFAQPESPAKEKVIRWGVIGTGHRCTAAHIPAMLSFDQTEIIAACDIMPNHLEQGLKKIGKKVEAYSDYQKLLANPDINAVVIATPNCRHKEIVVAALQAGKHVMCEKPMAVSIDECKAMKSAAEAAPKQIVLYTMQLRYSPHYQELRKAIEAGKIGKPKYLLMAEFRGDWNLGDVWKYTDPKTGKSMNWRFSHAASGGTLNEKVCHYFDILHWMVGAHPDRVLCDGGIAKYNDGRDTWDHASTTLVYPGGAKATHSLCMFGPSRLDLQVIGDEGSITVGEDSLMLQAKGKKPEELKLPEETKHGERGPTRGQETAVLRMYQDFIDCVTQNKKPWMDGDKAMTSSKTAWLGELSAERKQEVKWDDLA